MCFYATTLDVAELPSVANLRKKEDPPLTKVSVTGFIVSQAVLTIPKNLLRDLLLGTNDYWNAWIRGSTYDGSWKEAVHRSALALKLLIYEPTGSFVVVPITIPQLSVRCRGCQPNVQST
jgi:GH15 family glucan-1,4-alpha-glucosidase